MATKNDPRERIAISRQGEDQGTTVVSRRAYEKVYKSRGYKEVAGAGTAQVTVPVPPDDGKTHEKTKSGK